MSNVAMMATRSLSSFRTARARKLRNVRERSACDTHLVNVIHCFPLTTFWHAVEAVDQFSTLNKFLISAYEFCAKWVKVNTIPSRCHSSPTLVDFHLPMFLWSVAICFDIFNNRTILNTCCWRIQMQCWTVHCRNEPSNQIGKEWDVQWELWWRKCPVHINSGFRRCRHWANWKSWWKVWGVSVNGGRCRYSLPLFAAIVFSLTYANCDVKTFMVPKNCLKVGLICAAIFQDQWHRAKIVAVIDDTEVTVSAKHCPRVCAGSVLVAVIHHNVFHKSSF